VHGGTTDNTDSVEVKIATIQASFERNSPEDFVKLRSIVLFSAVLLFAAVSPAQQPRTQEATGNSARTRVVLLGTGTPVPDPYQSVPSPQLWSATMPTLSISDPVLCAERKPQFWKGA